MRYRFVVRGELGKMYATAFETATLNAANGLTAIELDVRDSAHLYGVIERVERLALELVCVQPVDSGEGRPSGRFPK